MLKIAVVLASLLAAASANKQVIPLPTSTCTPCQDVVSGLQDAVAVAKLGYYDAVTAGQCAALFAANSVELAFCTSVVATGKASLGKLTNENKYNPVDACISLGACPAKGCPAGDSNAYGGVSPSPFERQGQTGLCAWCSAGNVDAFTAEFLEETSKDSIWTNIRICSIDQYRTLTEAIPLANQPYWTSEARVCVPSEGCNNGTPTNDYHSTSIPNTNFINKEESRVVLVTPNAGPVVATAGATTAARVCLCANYGDNVPRASL